MAQTKSHILVVDDDLINRDVLRDTLEDCDYKITTAINGTEAIKIVSETDIDLILLDVMMPGLNGFDTCKEIKKVLSNKNIPIIFLTARTSNDDIINGFECGAVDYVAKPINNYVLLSRVKAHLGLKIDHDSLEKIIQDRTAALHEAVLKAEAAEEAKRAFTANMCHELRTPLNGILGTHEILLTEELDSEIMEMLELSRKSTVSLTAIINDILHFTEIESEGVKIRSQVFDCTDIIETVKGIFEIEAKEKGLELLIAIDESFPSKVLGDAARIRQLILNILGNAIKFTSEGSVTAIIKSTLINSMQIECTIEVSDTGIGMSENEQEILFKEFKQGDDSYTKKYAGIGIGLTNVKKFLDMVDGRISIVSSKDEGSTVSVAFPLLTV
ncbi:MAG: response regulator [Fibrobacterales bacterium]